MSRRVGALLPLLLAALVAATGVAHAAAPCATERPWCDAKLSADTRAGLLLKEMTLEEKLELMAGDDAVGVLSPGDGRHIGTSNGIPRLGVPRMYYTDGPVGIRQDEATAMPAPIGLAATFDPELARRYGAVLGNEAKLKGNDALHAPTINIMRTPLGGRTFEGYGEDPFLVSRLGVGFVRGVQEEGVLANPKHYAANNQETNRFTVSANVDQRTLREVYLPHFEAAVKEANAATVMCAYNRVNGQKACENKPLLEDILKREWGFDGFVLSDYGFAVSSTEGAANGGLELEMPLAFFYRPSTLQASMQAGRVSSATIDERVRRILRTMFAFGIFDREPYTDDDRRVDKPAHARTAQEVEEAAITLLKNDGGVLPLAAAQLSSIAVIGRDADRYRGGGGSGAVTPYSVTTPRAGIERRAGSGVQVRFDNGSDPGRAAGVARDSDVAVVVVSDNQTEFADKPCLTLRCGNPDAGDQDGLVTAVASANRRTIVVSETGGPVLMPWAAEVPAIVQAWYPGQEGGTALARVLFGDVDPGGRLPATFPRREEDKPPGGGPERYPGVADEEAYSEGVFVGYRYYDERGTDPLFPFGHGLSYTTFGFENLSIRATGADRAEVSVDVVNTGSRRGWAVPQLYLGLPEPSPDVQQPPRQIRGFSKDYLSPGVRRRFTFRLDARSFSYWDVATRDWAIADGCYRVMVGASSRDIRLTGELGRNAACAAGAVPFVTPPTCLPARARVRRGRIASVRLGQRRVRARADDLLVARRCVTGGGGVTIVSSSRGDARLVVSTARGHRARGIGPGSSLRALRRAYKRRFRLGPGLYGINRAGRIAFAVRDGRVRAVAVIAPGLRGSKDLRAYLRRAGLAR